MSIALSVVLGVNLIWNILGFLSRIQVVCKQLDMWTLKDL